MPKVIMDREPDLAQMVDDRKRYVPARIIHGYDRDGIEVWQVDSDLTDEDSLVQAATRAARDESVVVRVLPGDAELPSNAVIPVIVNDHRMPGDATTEETEATAAAREAIAARRRTTRASA